MQNQIYSEKHFTETLLCVTQLAETACLTLEIDTFKHENYEKLSTLSRQYDLINEELESFPESAQFVIDTICSLLKNNQGKLAFFLYSFNNCTRTASDDEAILNSAVSENRIEFLEHLWQDTLTRQGVSFPSISSKLSLKKKSFGKSFESFYRIPELSNMSKSMRVLKFSPSAAIRLFKIEENDSAV